MTDPFPIRPISADEFPAYFAVGEHAFNSSWPTQPSMELELVTFEPERSLAAFDGPSIVGTTTAFTFRMAVPGGLTPLAGVSFVAVLPTYRRRGILSSLMRRQLADIREQGEPVAALFASESGIYGRYGYGCASEQLRFSIRRGEGTLRLPDGAGASGPGQDGRDDRAGQARVRIRAADPELSRPEFGKVYESIFPHRPGMLARDDRWWTAALADPEYDRRDHSPLRGIVAEDDGGPRGYALFSATSEWGEDAVPSGVLSVRELLSADPTATAALWADLLTRDLIGEVRARIRPVDDPLLQLLADRRRARAHLTDGLWVRLIDVAAALAGRRYACEVDVVIEVADDLLPGNSGRWRLRAGGPGDPGPARCERTTAAAAIGLPAAALGAAYLGGTRLGALAAAGQVTELRPGALAALSTAMSWDPAPWCPVIF
jgi:predicted acetyltransferase